MSSITVELDAENDAYVREEAARLGISIEEVIRRAVDGSRCEPVTAESHVAESDPFISFIGSITSDGDKNASATVKQRLYGFPEKKL